jgi:prevent-host-death family protein
MTTDIGLRELRQQASELVRRAEAGEEIIITVAGRPSVRLVRAARRSWRPYEAISDLFAGPADPHWDADRELLDQGLHDPSGETRTTG